MDCLSPLLFCLTPGMYNAPTTVSTRLRLMRVGLRHNAHPQKVHELLQATFSQQYRRPLIPRMDCLSPLLFCLTPALYNAPTTVSTRLRLMRGGLRHNAHPQKVHELLQATFSQQYRRPLIPRMDCLSPLLFCLTPALYNAPTTVSTRLRLMRGGLRHNAHPQKVHELLQATFSQQYRRPLIHRIDCLSPLLFCLTPALYNAPTTVSTRLRLMRGGLRHNAHPQKVHELLQATFSQPYRRPLFHRMDCLSPLLFCLAPALYNAPTTVSTLLRLMRGGLRPNAHPQKVHELLQ